MLYILKIKEIIPTAPEETAKYTADESLQPGNSFEFPQQSSVAN